MSMKISFFHNLPSGGGSRMLNEIIKRYKNKYEITIYVIGEKVPKKIPGVKVMFTKIKPPRNFFLRQIYIIFYLPIVHYYVSKSLNKNGGILFATHDYLTKSPYILRFFRNKKIYLCQEPQREFYEEHAIHTSNTRERLLNLIRYPIKIIDEINTKHCDILLCNSKYSKGILEKTYQLPCSVVFPGVDSKLFCPKNTQKKKDGILFVGGLNTVKDPIFFIKCIFPIMDTYKIRLVGSGKPSYINKIKNISKNKNIYIYQNIPDNKLRDFYRKSFVTCITAHLEPFGLSSIESQSCGTPVVSVNEGGVVETVIDTKTGYLCERDKNIFLEKIKLAIENNNELGKNARKNVLNNWSWDKTLTSLDKIIENELKNSKNN